MVLCAKAPVNETKLEMIVVNESLFIQKPTGAIRALSRGKVKTDFKDGSVISSRYGAFDLSTTRDT